ncbi:beta-ketoacyl-[acyl-carrier-protein] synthase family protein [Kitasatospora cineracea]|uniref:beta-ketoacyl-[acyl-carrier-protein] synthase family protein n=1 Tax=Kitasatospora cineracea TaxID=88074 RepID=UPI0037A1054B
MTGLGMITPAGTDTASTWRTVTAGRPTAAPTGGLRECAVSFACSVPDSFDPVALLGIGARRMDRFIQLAVAAARQALDDAALDVNDLDRQRVGVVLGTGFAGTGTWEAQLLRLHREGPAFVTPLAVPATIANMAAAQICLDSRLHGPALSVSTACASGTNAVALGMDLIRAGRCDVVLAGGTEASITPLTATAFHRLGALSTRHDAPGRASRPFDRDRDGFVLAEGAAVLVLEAEQHARARLARPYAQLLGAGASTDAHHLTTPDPEGRQSARALELALADAGVSAADVAHVNAHATGTPHGDASEARTIRRFFPHRPSVTAVKGSTGHLLAAAGAVEAAITALTIHHRTTPAVANLTTPDDEELDLVTAARPGRVPLAVTQSFGFGGHNAALVLAEA